MYEAVSLLKICRAGVSRDESSVTARRAGLNQSGVLLPWSEQAFPGDRESFLIKYIRAVRGGNRQVH
jgi:hypothetical protein